MQKGSVNKVILVGHLGETLKAGLPRGGPLLQHLVWQPMNLEKIVRETGKTIQSGTDACCLVSRQSLLGNM